jgi:hypothetical protein
LEGSLHTRTGAINRFHPTGAVTRITTPWALE